MMKICFRERKKNGVKGKGADEMAHRARSIRIRRIPWLYRYYYAVKEMVVDTKICTSEHRIASILL